MEHCIIDLVELLSLSTPGITDVAYLSAQECYNSPGQPSPERLILHETIENRIGYGKLSQIFFTQIHALNYS